MTIPSTVRPAVSRVLQRCRISPAGTGAAALPSQPTPVPARLQPALRRPPQQRGISSSAPLSVRKTRDSSKLRGVSTIHRSGPREVLSVSNEGIPQPSTVESAGRMTESENDPNHGLWGFFFDKQVVPKPGEAAAYGRAWTVQELRGKSWEDLHALWWVCCRERNRIATANYARDKYDIGFGAQELGRRDETVRRTMKSIKHVLTERYYAWEDAVKLAKEDPEIDLSGNGPMYTPSTHYEEEPALTAQEEREGGAVQTAGADVETAEDAPSKEAATVDPSTMPPPAAKEEAPATRS